MDAAFGDALIALPPNLRRFALSLSLSRRADLVQITVERAITHAASIDRRARLEPWLLRIIRNAWIDQTRRQRTAGIQLDIFEMPEALPTELSMIATFRPAEGQLCREYETAWDRMLRIVLACRDTDGWQAHFAARSQADDADYRPAS
ncbi:sigma factor, partial [Paracoccus sp. PXZ]